MQLISLFVLQSSGMLNLLFPLLIFGFFYFFFIRPQVKKQKEQTLFNQSIQKGDEIVTSSGIIGQINKIEDGVITLQIDSKTFIRIMSSAVSKEMTDAYNSANKAK